MVEPALFVSYAVATGVIATVVMDGWSQLQKRVFGVPVLDYALVGRWLGHMAHGRLRHAAIEKAAPIAGERTLGWTVHYAIGIAFAMLPPALRGAAWIGEPSFGLALLVGVATIAAPFLIMQPAMGRGIAASRTPNPGLARWRSLATHLSFGIGSWPRVSGAGRPRPGDHSSTSALSRARRASHWLESWSR